tara:strand:- start:839 stop:1282 length:444 start_codon:yes stop_codon:yes gene_type:complete
MSIGFAGWRSAGFAYKNAASLSNSFTVHACTEDTTNSPESSSFPRCCNIQSIEVQLSSLSGSPSTVTLFLARDSDGDVGITPGATSGATQTIQVGKTTAADGTVVFAVDSDFHFDSGVANSAAGTLYAVVKLNQGTATANIRVNWRG